MTIPARIRRSCCEGLALLAVLGWVIVGSGQGHQELWVVGVCALVAIPAIAAALVAPSLVRNVLVYAGLYAAGAGLTWARLRLNDELNWSRLRALELALWLVGVGAVVLFVLNAASLGLRALSRRGRAKAADAAGPGTVGAASQPSDLSMGRTPLIALACVIPIVTLQWLLMWGYLNSGIVRSAGSAHGIGPLRGEWVLDHVRGEFDVAPPERLWFSDGVDVDRILVSDGQRQAEFTMRGLGEWIFSEGSEFAPLLTPGSAVTHTMTHFCPPLPAWDHLNFFPDAIPMGRNPERRVITYERE